LFILRYPAAYARTATVFTGPDTAYQFSTIPCLKNLIAIMIPIENLSRINQTLIKIFRQTSIFLFQSSFDFKISIAITIAFENCSRINQTLIFIFQSNLA